MGSTIRTVKKLWRRLVKTHDQEPDKIEIKWEPTELSHNITVSPRASNGRSLMIPLPPRS